ncbi:MAG: tetratricopeptide repeat protein [Bacteroidales bacterium]|nr:tetratricopeptide repeat protein [Bacteroidales bacterium]
MKRLLPILLLTVNLLACLLGVAAENDGIAPEAEKAYQQGQFSQAAKLYEQFISEGNESAQVYYNLGNAYYKAGSLSKAILWYERAFRLDPTDKDIQHNLAFANRMLLDRYEPAPQSAFVKKWNNLSHSLSERNWAILSIVFAFLIALSVGTYLFASGKAGRITGILGMVLGTILIVLSIIFASKEKNRFKGVDEAIVMESVVHVTGKPDRSAKPEAIIHEGLKVTLIEQTKEFTFIGLPNGDNGWVLNQSIEKI